MEVKRYDGEQWVTVGELKFYDGSQWISVSV